MSHVPYFAFYPADFMNGVRGLTPQEVGVYTMILCRIYEESGPVEYHVRRLATYCGMREAAFTSVVEKLVDLDKLQLVDGKLFNRRAEGEIAKRANGLKVASKAGKASAEKRQQNQRASSTTVEQTFNHTDTDTDTDIKDKTSIEVLVIPPAIDEVSEAVSAFNEMASRSGWPEVKRMSKPRFSALKARLKDSGGIEGWRDVLTRAASSDFLCGRSAKPFLASFDFLTQSSSFTKLMEGNYDNRSIRGAPSSRAFDEIAAAARAR